MVGKAVGGNVGGGEGRVDGTSEGSGEGWIEGSPVGRWVGRLEGSGDGVRVFVTKTEAAPATMGVPVVVKPDASLILTIVPSTDETPGPTAVKVT